MLSAGKAGKRKAGIKAGEEILVSYVSDVGVWMRARLCNGDADELCRGKGSGRAGRRWSVSLASGGPW